MLLADVEGLSENHDQVFMSFNIEHWYSVLGPTKTSSTTFLPLSKSTAMALSSLHNLNLTKGEISSHIKSNEDLCKTCIELQRLISPEGSFIKTSARSCKDIALQIGLMDRYRDLLSVEITNSGSSINEMRLRSLFMEAGRQVLRFKDAHDFLVACVLSNRVSGVTTSSDPLMAQDIERALRDDLREPLSFVIREWMPICPPEFVYSAHLRG